MRYPPPCSEPDGNRILNDIYAPGNREYAHDVAIEEGGLCPWCGQERRKMRGARS